MLEWLQGYWETTKTKVWIGLDRMFAPSIPQKSYKLWIVLMLRSFFFFLKSKAHFEIFQLLQSVPLCCSCCGLAAKCQKDLNWAISVKLGLLPSAVANFCLLISQGKLILDWTKSELISLSADQTLLEVFPSLKWFMWHIDVCHYSLIQVWDGKEKQQKAGFFGLSACRLIACFCLLPSQASQPPWFLGTLLPQSWMLLPRRLPTAHCPSKSFHLTSGCHNTNSLTKQSTA